MFNQYNPANPAKLLMTALLTSFGLAAAGATNKDDSPANQSAKELASPEGQKLEFSIAIPKGPIQGKSGVAWDPDFYLQEQIALHYAKENPNEISPELKTYLEAQTVYSNHAGENGSKATWLYQSDARNVFYSYVTIQFFEKHRSKARADAEYLAGILDKEFGDYPWKRATQALQEIFSKPNEPEGPAPLVNALKLYQEKQNTPDSSLPDLEVAKSLLEHLPQIFRASRAALPYVRTFDDLNFREAYAPFFPEIGPPPLTELQADLDTKLDKILFPSSGPVVSIQIPDFPLNGKNEVGWDPVLFMAEQLAFEYLKTNEARIPEQTRYFLEGNRVYALNPQHSQSHRCEGLFLDSERLETVFLGYLMQQYFNDDKSSQEFPWLALLPEYKKGLERLLPNFEASGADTLSRIKATLEVINKDSLPKDLKDPFYAKAEKEIRNTLPDFLNVVFASVPKILGKPQVTPDAESILVKVLASPAPVQLAVENNSQPFLAQLERLALGYDHQRRKGELIKEAIWAKPDYSWNKSSGTRSISLPTEVSEDCYYFYRLARMILGEEYQRNQTQDPWPYYKNPIISEFDPKTFAWPKAIPALERLAQNADPKQLGGQFSENDFLRFRGFLLNLQGELSWMKFRADPNDQEGLISPPGFEEKSQQIFGIFQRNRDLFFDLLGQHFNKKILK